MKDKSPQFGRKCGKCGNQLSSSIHEKCVCEVEFPEIVPLFTLPEPTNKVEELCEEIQTIVSGLTTNIHHKKDVYTRLEKIRREFKKKSDE